MVVVKKQKKSKNFHGVEKTKDNANLGANPAIKRLIKNLIIKEIEKNK